MSVVKRTIIVRAADAALARALAAGIAGAPGAGMFIVALSPTGAAAATHYVSSGPIEAQFAALLSDATAMHAAAQQSGAFVSLAQCQALVANSIVQDAGAEAAQKTIELAGLRAVSSTP
jgi:hypothetical protein